MIGIQRLKTSAPGTDTGGAVGLLTLDSSKSARVSRAGRKWGAGVATFIAGERFMGKARRRAASRSTKRFVVVVPRSDLMKMTASVEADPAPRLRELAKARRAAEA
jgi:hypothetical protein